jgi:uncharacterized protein YndB with AHSA1/START domain
MAASTFDLRAERVLDAPPDAVFDTYTSPDLWKVLGSDSTCDLRVGGVWTIVGGQPGAKPFRETNRFTRVDRPRQISFRSTLVLPDDSVLERDVDATMEPMEGGRTKMVIVQRGFPTRESRDALEPAFPSIFDGIERLARAHLGTQVR